jgi:hypothetical protein
MADLKAGSLNVEITADNKRLEKGLKEAEQKVKQTDRKLEEFGKTAERSTEKAKGGFLEATGATQQFQSQISAALGVIAGFAAVGAIAQGIVKGFEDSREAVEKADTSLEAFEIRLKAIGAATPVFGQLITLGTGLADAFGRAAFEAKRFQLSAQSIPGLAGVSAVLGVVGARGQELEEAQQAERRAALDQQLGIEVKALQTARLRVQLQQAQLKNDQDQIEFFENQIKIREVEEERLRIGVLLGELEAVGAKNTAIKLRNAADDLKQQKLKTIELEKQLKTSQVISATVGGTTAIGAFTTAASIAKSSATVPQSSPAENAQVSLLEEANRLLGQLVSGQGTAFA